MPLDELTPHGAGESASTTGVGSTGHADAARPPRPFELRVVVVMGVAGAGKTAVGRALADRLGWPFTDADHLHPAENHEKMARGVPLGDADRAPWLERLRARIVRRLTGEGCMVLACSALTAAYRDALSGGDARVIFLHLDVPRAVLAERMRKRAGHFFPPSLLESQLATLETPHDAVTVDGAAPLDRVVEEALGALGPLLGDATHG